MAGCLAVIAGRDPLRRIKVSDECRMPCHFATEPTTKSKAYIKHGYNKKYICAWVSQHYA